MSDWKAREEATYWAKVPHQQAYKIYTILIEQKVKEGYGDLLWKRFMPPPNIGCLYTKRYLWEDNYETIAIYPR